MEIDVINDVRDPLHPYGNPCTFCTLPFDEENWGIMGWIGILPIGLCAECTAGIFSMVHQSTPLEELEELVSIRKMEEDNVEP
jgi:hypothetical protein